MFNDDAFDDQLPGEEISDTDVAHSVPNDLGQGDHDGRLTANESTADLRCGLNITSKNSLYIFYKIRNCHSVAVKRQVDLSGRGYDGECHCIKAYGTESGFVYLKGRHIEGIKKCKKRC